MVIDKIHVEEAYRGNKLGTALAKSVIHWFDGLIHHAALFVTKEEAFQKAALRIPKALRFKKLSEDVWHRDLTLL